MESWNSAAWAQKARELTRGNDKKKITAIHAGVTAGAAFVVVLVQLLLSEAIEGTSGLSGMGTRSILQTISMLMETANAVASPFWEFGFLFAAMLWVRGGSADGRDLLMGFRRAGSCLRLLLAQSVLYIVAGLFCVYASSYVYMLTPWSASVLEFAQTVNMDMDAASALVAQMDISAVDALLADMIPMLVIWGVMCLLVLVPMAYRFRMSNYLILEQERIGAVAAMMLSARMMRKNRFRMFLLDLRFWWYYALQLLCLGLCFADLWLPLLGVDLPVGNSAASMITYVVYLLALVAVRMLLRPQVEATYVLAYEHLRQAEPVLNNPVATPKNLPWDEE